MRKGHVLLAGMLTVLNSTVGSSLPSGAIAFIAEDLHVTNSQELALPISLFLVGYVLGPIVCGPLSETYGRKVVMLTTFIIYNAFTLGCALSPNWASLLVFRLLVGIGASAPISIVNGLFADIFNDPTIRGRITAAFMAVRDLP
jgi:MFS family permease